ncbi:hypothetical protein V2H45_01685 [Tumidithrix elongata RA019]|uniref:Uncharacterized protein n=1 Tax=Tumidithrix elongata BACA0141 TaxID=2716417 RepID=A0AAW9PQB0_9CYAN|nr:hypothetical protein [Tumidithrix elongata RA019]
MQDLGATYQIRLAEAIDLDSAETKVKFEQLFHPVKGAKTENISGFAWEQVDYFDTVSHAEKRKRWLEHNRQQKKEKGKGEMTEEDIPTEPNACTQNGVILTSMRHDRNHNGLWGQAQELREDFGAFAVAVLKGFGNTEEVILGNEVDTIAKHFKDLTGKALPTPASAVKIFLPTSVQGVNRIKSDSNQVGSGQKEDWLTLWLIAAGLHQYGISERIKVSDRDYDWRVVALEPQEINLDQYGETLDQLRKFNPPSGAYGVARFDAEMVLNFSLELLKHHPAKDNSQISEDIPKKRSRLRGRSIREFVSGFSGTHFGSKGQVYGVQEVFSLGLPNWIQPNSKEDINDYTTLLVIAQPR